MTSIPLRDAPHEIPQESSPESSHESPPDGGGRRFYLESYGCQMNVYDTDGMARLLLEHGYARVHDPEQADVLLVNTCSVREHAEERTLNRLAQFSHYKKDRPDLVVGVTGCMAQRLGAEIRRRLPRIDLVVGARSLPAVLEGIEQAVGRGSVGETAGRAPLGHAAGRTPGAPYLAPQALDHYLPPPAPPTAESRRLKGFVTIIRGCNKRCSYCIVPYTRGPEVSRSPAEIVDEVAALVAGGAVEIMLLGQNVNSYDAEGVDFSELLRLVGEVPGRWRLRFTTSHPRDMSPEIVRRIAAAPRLQPWLHLPVQSGSPRIVADMNREYSLEHYDSVVTAARETIPDLALTTDIIVGYPGESEADFELTVRFLERQRYDSIYAFKYSPRSGTPAAAREDAVSAEEKQRRLAVLLQLQRAIAHEVNQRWVGRELEVLVEGRDAKRGQWLCRTGQNKTLLLPGGEPAVGRSGDVPVRDPGDLAVGDFVVARVERAEGQTLYGRMPEDASR